VRKMLPLVIALAGVLSLVPGHAAPVAYSRPRPDWNFHPGRVLSYGARESGNWAGYNLGYISDGRKLYNQIAGTWTVPTPSLHASENEYSVDWIGIGGGCIDKNCLTVDGTLIQTGTGQYIDSSGNRTYFGWWEIIPGPILEIANFAVHPGDRMFAQLRQFVAGSDVWKIQLINQTTGQQFSTQVAYSSSHLTAEWIEERPSIDGLPAPLPTLTNPRFNDAKVNNARAVLNAVDAVVMTDGSSRLATPSNPDPDKNGFNVCTYSTSCAAPTGT